MSGLSEFFRQRDHAIKRYTQQGCTELDGFLKKSNFSLKQLLAAGVVYRMRKPSLADLHDLRITPLGQDYLCEDQSMQLIMVKPNCVYALEALIESSEERLCVLRPYPRTTLIEA